MKLKYIDKYNIEVSEIHEELEKVYEFFKEILETTIEPEFIKDTMVKVLVTLIVDYAIKCKINYDETLPCVMLKINENEVNKLEYINNGDLLINITRVEVESENKNEKKYRYVYGKVNK